jgi:D-lactate dehydrogenase (cytochrome)
LLKKNLKPLYDELFTLLGDRVSDAESVKEQHSKGESWHRPVLPDLVCFAESTEEVSAIVKCCDRHNTPMVAFGAGTCIEGQTVPLKAGVSIDMMRMNAIIDVNNDDLDCRVQAGVTRKQLNNYLRDTGLFFPIDPGADASIGGMCATRASGTNAVRYGTMRENVLALTVVCADGSIIHTGTRARKSSAGYDLTRLYVGSEGTLGIITEIAIKLYGRPESMSSAVVNFPDVNSAVMSVIETIQLAIPVARIELLDAAYMALINDYSKTHYPLRDTLFLEFHGTTEAVAEQVALFKEIAKDKGGGDFKWADKDAQRKELWNARHNAYYAALAKHPNKAGFTTDVCVPISRLAQCISTIQAEMSKSILDSPILGHVGDGNFHLVFCIDASNEVELKEVNRLNALLVQKALELGGTCTGEHGVGTGKLRYMRQEHGDGAIEIMQRIKKALDPKNLFNPGKTIDC